MGSSPKGESDEIQREDANSNSTHNSFSQIDAVTNRETVNIFSFTSSHRGLLQSSGPLDGVESKTATQKKPKGNLSRFFIRPPRRTGFLKLGSPTLLVSPSKTIQRIAEEKDGISRATPTPTPTEPVHGLKEGFNMPFVGEVRWATLNRVMKEWLRNPKNLALLIWGTAVAVSGAILFMVMIGLLNSALPHKKQRDAWFEVNNQILNALFTLMCLYQHPQRFYHLALLYRWGPDDIIKLRKIYCKNGTYKPHEWAHMMVVVLLLHVNCFAQYALCGLNWGYKRSDRPAVGVGLCLAVAIGAPAIAGLYVIHSPLGRDYEADIDLEAGISTDAELAAANDDLATGKQMTKLLEKRYSFIDRGSKRMEPKPEWKGGLFDCWGDPILAFYSTFCGFCVFGWNMDRLGFGNMYVHIVTFILFCMAPFWIFNLAAINSDNTHVRGALGITGIVLCVFGLFYGGFWRIQMRKRFGLPGNSWCFGHHGMTDCAQWLFCSICSLCQEVRTGDFYEVCDNKLYPRQCLTQISPRLGGASPGLSPVCREPKSPAFSPAVKSPVWVYSGQSPPNDRAPTSSAESPMGQSSLQEGSSVCFSPYRIPPISEIHIQHSLAFESEATLKETIQTKKPVTEDNPMNAPIPITLQSEEYGIASDNCR